MNKICLHEEQVSNMMDALIVNAIPEVNVKQFVDREEALKILRCSAGTLQKLRDEDRIEFYSVTNKLIIYNYHSLVSYVKSKSNLI